MEDVSPAVRREVATVLAHVKNARCRALLVPLIHDVDSEVARVAIRSAHMLAPADILLVPALIARLGHRVLKPVAREALSTYGDHGCEVLAHVLSDAQENRWIRRHVPGTLARIPRQRSLDILLGASADPDGFVRFKALAAVERLHRQYAHLLVNRETVERRLIEDVKKYHGVLTLRFNLGRHDQLSERSLLERAFDDKLRRIADRIFRLLALIQPWKEVEAARSALGHRKGPQGPHDGITNDRRAAVAAVEYFDNIVSHSLRKWLMPILDDMPMAERVRIANTLLRTRPRDLEDTVAQLVHDDDRVISAGAIQFVWKRRMLALVHDLEYVRDHARIDDALVSNSASWALDTWSSPDVPVLPLPIIEVVDRLRRIPLFERLSVDEMVRIANLGSQLTYSSGDTILNEGVTAERVVCLLDRPVSLATGQVYRELRAPAVLAFDEMLERQQLRETVIALDYAACLALRVDDFLAMISDDIQVVQGLFRTLLGSADERHHVPVHSAPRTVALAHRHTGSLKPLEKLFVPNRIHCWREGR